MSTITRPAALVRQGTLKLFATSLQVSDLQRPNFYSIDRLDPDDEGPAYQRLLNRARARKLSEYLLDGATEGDAFLPTSIFLATTKDISFDSVANTITFDVGQIGPFNVVDGQHRIAGLVMAAEKNADLLGFEIPVNIAVGLDDISQMCHFLIVNTTQKPVNEALAIHIRARLSKMIGLEKMPALPRWIRRQVEKGDDARALSAAEFLNKDLGSPWRGKIRMANDESNGGTINLKSFIKSIKKYIFSANNPLSNPVRDEKRPKILSNYWNAIVELLIDGQPSTPSVLYKTNGVDLFHIVSATVFTYLASLQDFTKDAVKVLLQKGFENLPEDSIAMSHTEWWNSGGVASGLNTGSLRKFAAALSYAINVQGNTGGVAL